MKQEEILKKAILRAHKNGYLNNEKIQKISIIFCCDCIRVDIYGNDVGFPFLSMQYEAIIFSHEFAKAFWGAEKLENALIDEHISELWGECGDVPSCCLHDLDREAWKYHLQKIILEEEPIKYLENFLEN